MYYIYFRNEIDGKKYMEQLQSRQNAYLASENSSSGTSEEVRLNKAFLVFECISYYLLINYNILKEIGNINF